MSEVGDAIQIVMMSGRGVSFLLHCTVKTAVSIVKMLNTLYLSKWEGKTSFNRLRSVKGDDLMFINVSTEDKAALSAIEKSFKGHGILFARLPDLCGGDGRTQYVISSSDIPKMKAMLIDHKNSSYAAVSVAPIGETEYVNTGIKKDGSPTAEYSELQKSARENTPSQVQEAAPEYRQDAVIKVKQTLKRPEVRSFERQMEGMEQSVTVIHMKPAYEDRKVSEFIIPGTHYALFIPRDDVVTLGQEKGFMITAGKNYHLLDLAAMSIVSMNAEKVVALVKSDAGLTRSTGERKLERSEVVRNAPDIGESVKTAVEAARVPAAAPKR